MTYDETVTRLFLKRDEGREALIGIEATLALVASQLTLTIFGRAAQKKMLDPRWINTFSEPMALPLNGRTSTTSESQS